MRCLISDLDKAKTEQSIANEEVSLDHCRLVLEKSKTEQSIINEEARLDHCRLVLEKTKKEYDQKRYEYMCKLANLEDTITTLETSISNGERFIEDCKNHLKDFENGEINQGC